MVTDLVHVHNFKHDKDNPRPPPYSQDLSDIGMLRGVVVVVSFFSNASLSPYQNIKSW